MGLRGGDRLATPSFLNNIFFQAAATAVQEVLGSDIETPALVLTVQTAGESLNFNPHLHGLLADGTFDAAGNFTIPVEHGVSAPKQSRHQAKRHGSKNPTEYHALRHVPASAHPAH